MKAIAIALAFLDFAPVFFLSLGLFFLAQLVDRLDPRCRRMVLTGLVFVTAAGLSRAVSNLAQAFSGQDIPLLTTTFYVFGGPGFTLMAAALIRARATARGHPAGRDPWLAPTLISWLFLIAAFYLEASFEGEAWSLALLALSLSASTAVCLASGALGWKRHLHMAAALFAFNVTATILVAALRVFIVQTMWIQIFALLTSLAAQSAFAFASWRVAAEYQARVGPTAAV